MQANFFGDGLLSGVGLHSGRRFHVQVEDHAEQEAGPIFRVWRGADWAEAPARVERLSGTTRSTALVLRGPKRHRAELRTVEHLLAALHVFGLPKWRIHIREDVESGDWMFELPALGGEALSWIDRLKSRFEALKSDVPQFVWRVKQPFRLESDQSFVSMAPSATPSLASWRVSVAYGSAWQQECSWSIDWTKPSRGQSEFLARIAPARTFGFEHELKDLETRGLAQGGSFDNAILLGDSEVRNPGGLRLPNELAAHKLLDLVGDWGLAGLPILGDISAHRAGHALHLRALAEGMRRGIFERTRLHL